MENRKFRNYVFTINNYGDEELKSLRELSGVQIMVFQQEQGESGTKHLQGYVEWRNACDLIRCRRRLGGRAHVEVRKGSRFQAVNYASKQKTRQEGTEPYFYPDEKFVRDRCAIRRGERTDIEQFRLGILSGASELELSEQFPSM